jgi:hypothetical protein
LNLKHPFHELPEGEGLGPDQGEGHAGRLRLLEQCPECLCRVFNVERLE